MWGVVGQLTALKAREGMGAGGNEGMEWAVVDEDGLERLTRVSLQVLSFFLSFAPRRRKRGRLTGRLILFD